MVSFFVINQNQGIFDTSMCRMLAFVSMVVSKILWFDPTARRSEAESSCMGANQRVRKPEVYARGSDKELSDNQTKSTSFANWSESCG